MKSITPVPLIRTGVTPSGMRPGFDVSKTATLPPGPVSGNAIRSALAETFVHNDNYFLMVGLLRVI